jgi:threonine/homoserine/homoserine lactone efflux protein
MVLQAGVTVVAGVLFGLALAAPPGPMNAIIAEESVVQGWVAGFKTGLGAMTADVVFFLLALGGVVAVVERFPGLRHGMITVGGLLMLYFALGAARSVRATLAPDRSTDASRGFRKAFLLALTNPYQILFWLTVGVGLLDPGQVDVLEPLPVIGDMARGLLVVETGSVALVGGLFAGIVLWIVGFPAVLVAARERVELLAPLVALLSAVVLAASGVFFLFEGLTGLFPA